MKSVIVAQHLRMHKSSNENVKFIGVYKTLRSARAAIARLRKQPGFRDFPRIVEPLRDDDPQGFYVDRYELNKDHWTERFG